MQDLHLVGITTDRTGLIFSTADGAKAGSFVVPVDAELRDAVETILAELPEEADEPDDGLESRGANGSSALPVQHERAESKIPIREVQSRLRAGEPLARVARAAGVDEGWLERFAAPVWAEQRRIIQRTLDAHLERARAGRSVLPLRRAISRSLAAKGVGMGESEFDQAWSSRLVAPDWWVVEFTYSYRGTRTLSFDFNAADGELTTDDRTASQMGFVAEGTRVTPRTGVPIDGVVGDAKAYSARTSASGTSRSSGNRGTGKGSASAEDTSSGGERATTKRAARKATPRRSAKKRPPTKGSAPKKRAEKKTAAPKKQAPKKRAQKKAVAPKKRAPKKRAQKKAAAPKKRAKKAGAAKKAGGKKTGGKKAAAKKRPATKKTAAEARPASTNSARRPDASRDEPSAARAAPTEKVEVSAAPGTPAVTTPAVTMPAVTTPVVAAPPTEHLDGPAGEAPAEADERRPEPSFRAPVVRGARPAARVAARHERPRARIQRAAPPSAQGPSAPASPSPAPDSDGHPPEADADTGPDSSGAARPRRRRQLRAR